MGITDSKQISQQIDKQFKSIRKYKDNFYGQMTLVQCKNTQKSLCLIQKVMYPTCANLSTYLQQRKSPCTYLLQLHQYYHCQIDYCSGLQKYFFLIQYSEHTLYEEMIKRQQIDNKFNNMELIILFSAWVDIIQYQQKNPQFRFFVSNHFVMYYSNHQLKTIENLIKVDNDTFQFDFHIVKHQDGSQQLYLAPQAYYLLCNKQRFQAKNVSLTQKAIIFMLGMNFIQCALLTDISGVYNQHKKSIDFQKLRVILQEMQNIYGQQIVNIICQMIAQNPQKRPPINQIQQMLKSLMKKRKIIIPKSMKSDKNSKKSSVNEKYRSITIK